MYEQSPALQHMQLAMNGLVLFYRLRHPDKYKNPDRKRQDMHTALVAKLLDLDVRNPDTHPAYIVAELQPEKVYAMLGLDLRHRRTILVVHGYEVPQCSSPDLASILRRPRLVFETPQRHRQLEAIKLSIGWRLAVIDQAPMYGVEVPKELGQLVIGQALKREVFVPGGLAKRFA